MTKEKYLELINKAIEELTDEDSKVQIDFMRKQGIKTADHAQFGWAGAYLEEIRCSLLSDIESEAAKSGGKSAILSNVKKFGKMCAKLRDRKPALGWANYDEEDNKYFLIDGYCLLVSESSEGMELTPEAVKDNIQPFNYKKSMPHIYEYQKKTLPPIGKITAWRKQAKAKAGKSKGWDVIYFNEFGVNGEYLEMFMRITGATEIYYKDNIHSLYMEGNGYQAVIMPVKNYDFDKDTGDRVIIPATDLENF